MIISDCYAVYYGFAKHFQKCWAHLLRRTHYLAEQYPRRDIVKLHELLTHLFNEMSNFLEEDPPPELRERNYKLFRRKLADYSERLTHFYRATDCKRLFKAQRS